MSAVMEEISDDGNGDSTFEFVGDKNDEGSSQYGTTTTIASSLLPEQNDKSSAFLPNVTPDTMGEMYSLAKEEKPVSLVANTDALQPPQPTPFFPAIPQAIQTTPSTLLYYPVTSSSFPEHTNTPFRPSTVQSPMPTEVQPSSVIAMPSATVDLPIEQFSLAAPRQTLQEGNGMWGWLKGSELLNKVAEKAKNSVDSMITTLDPGMKEIIYSGGNISIIVASDKEVKVSPIREAFQYAFGRATVEGAAAQSSNIAVQPVGFAAGLKAAEERISYLKNQGVYEHQPIVAVENFLVELTPDRWYDVGCLVLQDSRISLTLHTYTQTTPVPIEYVTLAQEQTPSDYPLRWSGLAVTIGQVMSSALGISRTEWHLGLLGVSRREMLLLAAKSLAGLYKSYLTR